MEKISNAEFMRLVRFMRDGYGINLEQQYTLVETRIGQLARIKGFSTFNQYLDYVESDRSGGNVQTLITRLTTNYTYFMRESEHYEYLKSAVLPELRNSLVLRDLRIWSAGCSSGEEAYTMAMELDEFFGPQKKDWDTTILATDISPVVLMQAREGIYPAERLSRLPDDMKSKYFDQLDRGHYKIRDFIQREVIFNTFNLMEKKFPFKKKFHIIFCRNVMIYFETKVCNELINRFYDHLENGGHLIVGTSETVDRRATRFKFVKPSIYRKSD